MFKNINPLTVLKFVLVALGVGSSLILFNGASMSDTEAVRDAYRDSSELGFAMGYTIGLISLGIVIVIGFFVFSIIIQPQKTLMSIIGLITSLVIFFIILAVGTSDDQNTLALKQFTDQSSVNLASAGIYTIGICLFIGFLAIVLGPFIGRYRK